jgi:hypothetical protein
VLCALLGQENELKRRTERASSLESSIRQQFCEALTLNTPRATGKPTANVSLHANNSESIAVLPMSSFARPACAVNCLNRTVFGNLRAVT